MINFASVEEMVKEKALQTHEANLNYGGVFDENNNRISNLDFEIKWAAKKVVFVSKEYSPTVIGVQLSKNACGANYIRNFGYVEI